MNVARPAHPVCLKLDAYEWLQWNNCSNLSPAEITWSHQVLCSRAQWWIRKIVFTSSNLWTSSSDLKPSGFHHSMFISFFPPWVLQARTNRHKSNADLKNRDAAATVQQKPCEMHRLHGRFCVTSRFAMLVCAWQARVFCLWLFVTTGTVCSTGLLVCISKSTQFVVQRVSFGVF